MMANTTAEAAEAALGQCEAACKADDACTVCSVDCPSGQGLCQWVALPACGKVNGWGGWISGDISTKVRGEATLTATGPADVWFGEPRASDPRRAC